MRNAEQTHALAMGLTASEAQSNMRRHLVPGTPELRPPKPSQLREQSIVRPIVWVKVDALEYARYRSSRGRSQTRRHLQLFYPPRGRCGVGDPPDYTIGDTWRWVQHPQRSRVIGMVAAQGFYGRIQ